MKWVIVLTVFVSPLRCDAHILSKAVKTALSMLFLITRVINENFTERSDDEYI